VHLTTDNEIEDLYLASSSIGRKWPRNNFTYSVSKKSTINRALEIDYLKLASTWYQEKMAEKKVVAEPAVLAQLIVHLTTNHEIEYLNLASSIIARKWPRNNFTYSVSNSSTINRAF